MCALPSTQGESCIKDKTRSKSLTIGNKVSTEGKNVWLAWQYIRSHVYLGVKYKCESKTNSNLLYTASEQGFVDGLNSSTVETAVQMVHVSVLHTLLKNETPHWTLLTIQMELQVNMPITTYLEICS